MSRLFASRTHSLGRSRISASALDGLRGRAVLSVDQTERAIPLKNGKALGIFGPGEHELSGRFEEFGLAVEALSGAPEVRSPYALAMLREGRAGEEVVELTTGPGEVGLIYRAEALYAALPPESRVAYWTALGPFRMEKLTPKDGEEIPAALTPRLAKAQGAGAVSVIARPQPGQSVQLFVSGEHRGGYGAGLQGFWSPNGLVGAQVVDLRTQTLEVSGQEILTADRVSLRLSAAASYRVTNPKLALTAVEDYGQALYLALQLAMRATVSARTLDALLSERVAVDEAAAGKLRAEMAAVGLEVGAVEMKDVILPGEMREILNRVVAAEKEAEANVIRRREETAATRSLLNTAKLMTENPAMMRLKELEALEAVASKVERLIVYGGPKGLLDVAKLDTEG
ncbi:slipin family protein [Neomegalonema sp.]|uniref:slipin family protein n=1 Tax=Neomegalonema sp. TaxID=2039713 RepID=UPI00262C83BE|nr:slipin family protein [Neomegalonema sp.]MDD2868220.1 slipin family protein [Neomegalonema sp.]